MVLIPTDGQCQKAISRIHNATDEVFQYGSVCDANDAEQAAGYLLWDVWSHSQCDREQPILGEQVKSEKSQYEGGRRWVYEILNCKKRLTLETNRAGALIGSWVR